MAAQAIVGLLVVSLVSPSISRISQAQAPTGSIVGRVMGPTGAPVAGATLRAPGATTGIRSGEGGNYRLDRLAPGQYRIQVRAIGFAPDSFSVQVGVGEPVRHDVELRPAPAILPSLVVEAQRLGETKVAALDRQQNADNIVSVLSGDEIRALPNGNAAEAAGRIPGVSLERDEGEGKFVQVRGTEPRLTNVTINGAHVPGTEQGNRIPKLDAVPSDILAAIEVSKTLTADMEADAIGGSVNLVTKTPEGRPRGYVAGQFGHTSLLDHTVGQGGFTYGGRFGAGGKLGFLLGGSLDRNNRVINDVEPAWTVDGSGRSIPVEWSERDYSYYRTRYGLGGDLDYRFNDHSTVYLKALWSLFKNHGTRYVFDVATSDDSAGAGPIGYGTGAALSREVSQRTPTEQMWGITAGGRQRAKRMAIDYSVNFAGTRQSVNNYRSSPFAYAGNGLTVKYDASNISTPTYRFLDAGQAAAAVSPSNYMLGGYDTNDGLTIGRDLGAAANLSIPYQWQGNAGGLKLGIKVRDEHKDFTSTRASFDGGNLMLGQVASGFSDPQFYSNVTNAFPLGPFPDNDATIAWENAHQALFTNSTDSVGNALATFSGRERVYAAYVMNTLDFGRFHLNLGVRLEHTTSAYVGHVASTPTDAGGNSTGPTLVTTVPGSQTYTDLFPSAQGRYSIDDNTNLRVAVTRGIARPNYADLAPSLSGNLGSTYQNQYSNLSAGNPDLRPQHAWNFDVMLERFLPSVGVLSAGVFYKRLTDVILVRDFIYQGPYAPFIGYRGTEPQNGGSGHLLGVELNWAQHLTFLPGILGGLGFDANYTHVDSRVVVDTSGREAPLLRQAPDLANIALTYDRGPVSSRAAWTYNGANIAGYGDGTSTANGDNHYYAHSQIDASIIVSVMRDVQVQLQGLNLNNAVFGFFNGTPDRAFSVQREYYGRTFYFGIKYGF